MVDDGHGVWDYLASVLILEAAGGVAAEVFGRELCVLDHAARRSPVVAATPELLDELLRRRAAEHEGCIVLGLDGRQPSAFGQREVGVTSTEVLGRVSGPVVMIGFGSIGRGSAAAARPPHRVRPQPVHRDRPRGPRPPMLDEYGVRYLARAHHAGQLPHAAAGLLTEGEGQGFCINLSVDTSSLDIMRLCRELGVLYIDTVVEPWPGFYYDAGRDNATRTNHALRAARSIDERRRVAGRHHRGLVLRRQSRGWCRGSSRRRSSELARDLAGDAATPTGCPRPAIARDGRR